MTSAFAAEVAAARPRVTAVVARLVGDDAEEVVRETILRAFLSLSQLPDRNRFESWRCGIALNAPKMHLRRAATEARLLAAGAGPAVNEPEPLAEVPLAAGCTRGNTSGRPHRTPGLRLGDPAAARHHQTHHTTTGQACAHTLDQSHRLFSLN